jgi:hypothetical protein
MMDWTHHGSSYSSVSWAEDSCRANPNTDWSLSSEEAAPGMMRPARRSATIGGPSTRSSWCAWSIAGVAGRAAAHSAMDVQRFDGAAVQFAATAEDSGLRLLALDDELEARILAGKP